MYRNYYNDWLFQTDSYDYEKLEFLIDEMQRIEDTSDGEKVLNILFM